MAIHQKNQFDNLLFLKTAEVVEDIIATQIGILQNWANAASRKPPNTSLHIVRMAFPQSEVQIQIFDLIKVRINAMATIPHSTPD